MQEQFRETVAGAVRAAAKRKSSWPRSPGTRGTGRSRRAGARRRRLAQQQDPEHPRELLAHAASALQPGTEPGRERPASTHARGLPEGETLGELPVMEQAQKKATAKPYSPQVREPAVRLAVEHRDADQSQAAALTAGKIGVCAGQPIRSGCARSGVMAVSGRARPVPGRRASRTHDRGTRELRQANEMLRKGAPLKAPLVQAPWRARIFPRVRKAMRHCFSSACSGPTALSANDCFH